MHALRSVRLGLAYLVAGLALAVVVVALAPVLALSVVLSAPVDQY